MKRLVAVVFLLIGILNQPARAADLDSLQLLTQNQFRLLSEDLGAALSYKPLTPAEQLGITGFDIGVQGVYTKLANTNAYKIATGSSDVNFILPQVHLYKGLPLGIDVGLSFAAMPDSNIKLWGTEIRYALYEGGPATPAVAVRASYSSLEGVEQLRLRTSGVDLSISKGFAFLTPYAGVGVIWVTSIPEASTGLGPEDFHYSKVFLGLNINLGVLNIAIEGDQTGKATSYGAKAGWRF